MRRLHNRRVRRRPQGQPAASTIALVLVGSLLTLTGIAAGIHLSRQETSGETSSATGVAPADDRPRH
jgi:hypothetical protein